MSISIFALVIFNVVLALGLVILWIRQVRPPKEDPRLSRGLQLLQSKIAVLEDLSDRTETQVKQVTMLLDERAKHLQAKMMQAEETMLKIDHSMRRSLDVAEIFQDKIPHQEILERNQQAKYVQAAKLANEGYSIDEIAAQLDIPRSEIELIAKVNKEELTFNTDLLPEWAKVKLNTNEAKMMEKVFQTTGPDLTSLKRIESDFKQTLRDVEELERQEAERLKQMEERAQALRHAAAQAVNVAGHAAGQAASAATQAASVASHAASTASHAVGAAARNLAEHARPLAKAVMTQAQQVVEQSKPIVRKVQFPRITMDRRQMPQTIED
jgi:hypothetical protein